jgi:ATP-binding cassette, subfamily G (WHITE), member 2, SNQ2
VYVEEDDVHFPTMSVEETLGFAVRARMSGRDGRPARPEWVNGKGKQGSGRERDTNKDSRRRRDADVASTTPPPISKEDEAEVVDTLRTVFGLRHVKGTKVWNASIWGVSGGERKRVSIAEALATRARMGCWDKCVHSFWLSFFLFISIFLGEY